MRRFFRISALTIAGIALLAVAVACVLAGTRAYLQHRNAERFAIHTSAFVWSKNAPSSSLRTSVLVKW